MIRKLNRRIQDYLRPKRLAFGKWLWDKKCKKYLEFIKKDGNLDMSKVKSILFLRYDGKIGDMVITTLIFRELKKYYKDIEIGVVTRGGAKDIIKFNPYIDNIYEYQKGKESTLAKKLELKYDVLVDFNEQLKINQMKFINLCKAKINIGLEKYDWNLFDFTYKKAGNNHISETYKNLLELLGIKTPNTGYDIFVTKEIEKKVNEKIAKLGEFIVLNPYAASKYRCFSKNKIIEIIDYCLEKFEKNIVIIAEKERKNEVLDIIKDYKNRVCYVELNGILEVVEMIGKAAYLITPDTSIVHIGVAKNIPMSAVYRADKVEDLNSKVWGPNSENAKQIFSTDRALKTGEETDINVFDVKELF